jgi:tetratricopeptide (TPR) repeat protein
LTAALFVVGTLVPVLGFLNVFPFIYSFTADHFQYLASLAIIALVSAGAALLLECAEGWGKWIGQMSCVALVAVLAVLSWRQSQTYADVDTLYRTTIARNPNCWMAHNNLGVALAGRRQIDEAIAHFKRVLEIKPDHTEAHNNLGNVLASSGRFDEAIAHYQKALEIKPDYTEAHNNLGLTLASCGRFDEAIAHYHKALEIKPDYEVAHNNLGNALAGRGQLDEAIAHYQKALEIKPDAAAIRRNLETVRAQRERVRTALTQRRELLRTRPKDRTLLNDTAWMLATDANASIRNGSEAVELAQRAIELSDSRRPELLGTLAAAYAETGRFAEAVQTARKAMALARQQNKQALAESIAAKNRLYEAGKPFHEPLSSPGEISIRP